MGFDPAGFWSLTPRMFAVLMAGAAERERRLDERTATAAWLTASLSRAKKLPKLSDLIRPARAPGRHTNIAPQLAALRARLPTITLSEWIAKHG